MPPLRHVVAISATRVIEARYTRARARGSPRKQSACEARRCNVPPPRGCSSPHATERSIPVRIDARLVRRTADSNAFKNTTVDHIPNASGPAPALWIRERIYLPISRRTRRNDNRFTLNEKVVPGKSHIAERDRADDGCCRPGNVHAIDFRVPVDPTARSLDLRHPIEARCYPGALHLP